MPESAEPVALRAFQAYFPLQKVPVKAAKVHRPASHRAPASQARTGNMAMKTKITAKLVNELTLPQGKTEEVYWDGDPPGFGLRLRRRDHADGEMTRTWIVQYKRDGETRRITIGKANVLGVEAARKAARKGVGKVMVGEDPGAERQKPRHTRRGLLAQYPADKANRTRTR